MPRIPEETKEEIIRLYNNGDGLPPAEIGRQTGVSYSSVYSLTRLRKRTYPGTDKEFESKSRYLEYLAKQKTNPETGKKYASRNQYQECLARQRAKRPKNKALSNLIKERLDDLGKNQAWLAMKMGDTRPTVSRYIRGRSIPRDLPRLFSSLKVPYKTLDDLLD